MLYLRSQLSVFFQLRHLRVPLGKASNAMLRYFMPGKTWDTAVLLVQEITRLFFQNFRYFY